MRQKPAEGSFDRGHVIRLDPTLKQANALARAAGVARFTYNHAREEWIKSRSLDNPPSVADLKKLFNTYKEELFPWITESPRDANSQPFADFQVALNNYFASKSGKRKGRRVGFPTRRRRGEDDSFYVSNDKFSVRQRGKRGVVRLPVIGDVRMQEALRYPGKILSGRVWRQADKWFISISVEVLPKGTTPHVHKRELVGIDLGLKTAIVPSQGEPVDAPKPLKKNLAKLRRANKRLHRRTKGGKNRFKARMKVARLHQKIGNVRLDFWHKETTIIARENQVVVIEDLTQEFMKRNRKLARAASDVGLGFLKRLLPYKMESFAGWLEIADRLYPSTQRCFICGWCRTGARRLKLSDRWYICDNPECGNIMDRDLNSAWNLAQYPWLEGNWGLYDLNAHGDCTSTARSDSGSKCGR